LAANPHFGEAKYWINRWYQDEPKKADIDEALKDNPQCEQLIDWSDYCICSILF